MVQHVVVATEEGVLLADRVAVADRFWLRMLGLAWSPPPEAGGGLLIPRCRAIHTFGMRYALDIVFLDAACSVIRVERDVRPGRFLVGGRLAASILEVPAGRLPASHPRPGERLNLRATVPVADSGPYLFDEIAST